MSTIDDKHILQKEYLSLMDDKEWCPKIDSKKWKEVKGNDGKIYYEYENIPMIGITITSDLILKVNRCKEIEKLQPEFKKKYKRKKDDKHIYRVIESTMTDDTLISYTSMSLIKKIQHDIRHAHKDALKNITNIFCRIIAVYKSKDGGKIPIEVMKYFVDQNENDTVIHRKTEV